MKNQTTVQTPEALREKVAKSANIAFILTKIFTIVLYVGCGLLLASIICFAIFGTQPLFTSDSITINPPFDPDMMMESISGELKSLSEMHKVEGILSFANIFLILLFIIPITFTAYHVFRDIRDNCVPFSADIAKKLKRIAIFMIALAVVPPTLIFIASCIAIMCGCMFSCNVTIDTGLAIIAVIMFCLSNIFEYGAALQSESDETL